MRAGSAIPSRSASLPAAKSAPVSSVSVDLAQKLTASIRRHYTAKEFSQALADLAGINLCERAIVRRCALPARDPRHIATNPAFLGRHYILASELARIAGTVEAAG